MGREYFLIPIRLWGGHVTNSRVIHEVVDFPHGDAAHVDEEDEAEQHQVVLRRHPQHELQIEGVQLRQKELQRQQVRRAN